jgi:hypothetical protein
MRDIPASLNPEKLGSLNLGFCKMQIYFSSSRIRGIPVSDKEAFEKHDLTGPGKPCRICSSPYSHETNPSLFCFCERCGYKILILLVIVMIVVSFVAWFGLF